MKFFLTLISWLSVLLLWGSAASVYVNPAKLGGGFALIGLAFPFFVGFVLFSMLLCLVCFRPKLMLIGLFGLIGCYGSLRNYLPINFPSPAPKRCLKVMTFNTMNFAGEPLDAKGSNAFVDYIFNQQRPDIVCLQEFTVLVGDQEKEKAFKKYLKAHRYEIYWEYDPIRVNQAIAIKEGLRFDRKHHDGVMERVCASTTNGATAYHLRDERDRPLTVISCHLESMKLSAEDRKVYSSLVHNPDSIDEIGGKRSLLQKVAIASHERAHQADTIATYLRHHKGERIIVMGDFNDSPISYARQRIVDVGELTDAFRAAGNGLGRSFNKHGMIFRIDHILCSKHYRPFATYVDNSFSLSDHYPMVAYLKPQ